MHLCVCRKEGGGEHTTACSYGGRLRDVYVHTYIYICVCVGGEGGGGCCESRVLQLHDGHVAHEGV